MSKRYCKFCGTEIQGQKYLTTKKEGSCPECTSYCMKQCSKAGSTTMSWHKEPCVSCEHNPYKKQYRWEGGKWVKYIILYTKRDK